MSEYVVGSKILKKEQVLISIFLIVILVLSSGSMVAFAYGGHTIVVKPSGDKSGATDTAAIQAALNACVGAGSSCTVQLLKGTYYISQIAVTGFQGNFIGMGQGVTVIQAIPNLPPPAPKYNTLSSPFWAGLPGPGNPWPALFTFVNGAFSISGMTVTEPYPAPISGLGWYFPEAGTSPYTSLWSAILVTGQQAYATIDHVTALGGSGDFNGYNMNWAIYYGGTLLPSVFTDPWADAIPLTGTFSLTNSAFNTVDNAAWVQNVVSASTTVCHNTVTDAAFSFSVLDTSSSNLMFCGNQGVGTLGYNGMQVSQSIFKSGLSPSTVYITGNTFQVNDGANGVWLADAGVPSTLNVVMAGNRITTDTSCGCYNPTNPGSYSVIQTISPLKSLLVSQNTIIGGGAAGVYVIGGPGQVIGNTILGSNTGVQVDYANGVQVTGNVIKNSAQWGIAVTDGSSNNKITGNFITGTASGGYDLYWDQTGSGNVWFGNLCGDHTSSPPGLC